jgi:hypothetical protein
MTRVRQAGSMSSRPPWQPVAPPPRGLVRPVHVDPTGRSGPTSGQARGPGWRRTSYGFYVPSVVDRSVPAQRVIEASVLLPDHGAVSGWAALNLARAAYFDGLLPDGRTEAPVALVAGPGHSRRARTGVRWLQDRIDGTEICDRFGVPCSTVLRAVVDEMRVRSVRHAVEAMDMVAAAGLTSIRRTRGYVEAHPRLAGSPVVRRALDLADETSRSPGETRTRLAWVLDARRPRPLTNREVFDDRGRLLGVADLIDPVAGVVGEYDGAEHARAARRSRDAGRDTAFRDHGLEVFRVTGYDEHHGDGVVGRIHSAYERAALNRVPRRWTLTPPAGWEVGLSLDDVFALHEIVHGGP